MNRIFVERGTQLTVQRPRHRSRMVAVGFNPLVSAMCIPWVETHGYPPGPLTRSVAGEVMLQQGLLIRLIQKIMVIPDWFC